MLDKEEKKDKDEVQWKVEKLMHLSTQRNFKKLLEENQVSRWWSASAVCSSL